MTYTWAKHLLHPVKLYSFWVLCWPGSPPQQRKKRIPVMLCSAWEAAESGRIRLEIHVFWHAISWSFSRFNSFTSLFNICPDCIVPLLPASSQQLYHVYWGKSGPKSLPLDQDQQLLVASSNSRPNLMVWFEPILICFHWVKLNLNR